MTLSEKRTRVRIPGGGYESAWPTDRSVPLTAGGKSVYGRMASTVLRKVLPLAVSLLLALPAGGDATALFSTNNAANDNSIQINKRVVSYTMLDNMDPLDSYVYSFHPPSPASVVPSAFSANAPIGFVELFQPIKRDSDKRSSDTDIPGVLRFGKRALAPEPLLGNPAGVLRFGKRDDMPGVLRFGKRAPMSDDMMPGVLRFGKREISGNMPAGVLRFGKKSDDMPGVLRFGRK